MITYTIDVTKTTMTLYDGQVAGSKLRWYADGFRVYVSGAVPVQKMDALAHMAMEVALSHHIPLRTLKKWCQKCGENKASKQELRERAASVLLPGFNQEKDNGK